MYEITGAGVYRLISSFRDLTHSADPEEIDHLEAYLNKQIPPLGNERKSARDSDPSL